MSSRIVITGLGTVNPCAVTVADTWEALENGRSGIDTLKHIDSPVPVYIGGEISEAFDPSVHMDSRLIKRTPKAGQFAVHAACQALEDAGLLTAIRSEEMDTSRVGVIFGQGMGDTAALYDGVVPLVQGKPRSVPVFTISMVLPSTSGAVLGQVLGLRGPNFSVSSACASSANAMITAMLHLRAGDVDVAITGGGDVGLSEFGLACFYQARALSQRNDAPSQASRPFDKDRDGFVMGNGATILTLERLEHAQARGAKIYAEVLSYGLSDDAFHLMQPREDGVGAACAMQMALDRSGLDATDVQLVNAHGTSTPLGDVAETRAVKQVFGKHAYHMRLHSTKSITGHLLGGAFAVESLAVLLALQKGVIHPTLNLDAPDPECDLNYTPHQAQYDKVHYVLSNSFGFGGHNASLLFGSADLI